MSLDDVEGAGAAVAAGLAGAAGVETGGFGRLAVRRLGCGSVAGRAFAGGFGFGVAVAVGEPASALEGDCRGGEDTLQLAAAMGADSDLGVRELLDLFGVLVAGRAFVFVKRHECPVFSCLALVYPLSSRRRCDTSSEKCPSARLPAGISVCEVLRLEFAQFDEADAGDGFYLAESVDGGGGVGGVGDVDLDYGEGLTLRDILRTDRTAEGEVRDVDAVLAEDGADAADNARDVLVADDDEGAGELGFDVDAVVVEQARRVAVQDGGKAGPVTLSIVAGDAFARPVQRKTKRGSGTAGDVLALVFLNADAALGSCRGGVDAIDAVGSVEDAGDGGVTDEVGLERGETAVVGDGDVFDAAGHSLFSGGAGTGGVAEELAETVCHLDVRGDLCVLLLSERRER